jgi:citrate synthase
MTEALAKGLEGVVAAETGLSHVDGAAGRLIVRGHDLEDLVAGHDFAGATALLWDGFAPEGGDAPAVRTGLGTARKAAWARVPALQAAYAALPTPLSAIEGLRLGLSLLADAEQTPKHLLAVGAVPVMLAAALRLRAGEAPVTPDPDAAHGADFLRMLTGEAPDAARARALEAYLVTVAEHGMNASTFAARVIASTEAGMITAVLGGLCALKGPLHGGAPGPVLDMLDAIGSEDNIRPWLEHALDGGEKLMGFGHRIYRTRDPRADVLKGELRRLKGAGNRIAFAEAVERTAILVLAERKPDRRLDTNVEFYTALLLEAVGVPRDAFTATFAMGRVAGWSAHVLEQMSDNRIIRPDSHYVGPWPRKAA